MNTKQVIYAILTFKKNSLFFDSFIQKRLKIREDTSMDKSVLPKEYEPISMWGYFGYEILFSIPVIGFLFLIIFAIGSKNVNKKNFARSYFCFTILVLLFATIVIAFAMLSGATDYLAQVLAG